MRNHKMRIDSLTFARSSSVKSVCYHQIKSFNYHLIADFDIDSNVGQQPLFSFIVFRVTFGHTSLEHLPA